jgi:hypothetical protein
VLEGSAGAELLTFRSSCVQVRWKLEVYDSQAYVSLDLLLHLNLFMMSLLLVQFCSEAGELLRVLGGLMPCSRRLLSSSFLMIKPPSVELSPPVHVPKQSGVSIALFSDAAGVYSSEGGL